MNRIALTALSAILLLAGIGGAKAAVPAADQAADHAGDRYTDALNLLESQGYTGISTELDEGGARADDGFWVVVSKGGDSAVVGREPA